MILLNMPFRAREQRSQGLVSVVEEIQQVAWKNILTTILVLHLSKR